jgi:hypothetical protein
MIGIAAITPLPLHYTTGFFWDRKLNQTDFETEQDKYRRSRAVVRYPFFIATGRYTRWILISLLSNKPDFSTFNWY